MDSAKTFYGIVNEDGTFSLLGRVCALTGTGTPVSKDEGNPIKQADVSSITCNVFDLATDQYAASGTEVTPAPTVTAAAAVYDTLQKLGWPAKANPAGYNFRHDVSVAYAPTGGNWYLFRYKFTLTDGTIIWHRHKVKALARGGN